MKKVLYFLLALILVVAVVFMAGPRPPKVVQSASLPKITKTLEELEESIELSEAQYLLKPRNESQLIWQNDSFPQQTEYALIYLHGFSATAKEGDPLHLDFAKRFGMNAYLPRLAGHGLDTNEPFIDITASDLIQSAEHALAIGKRIGKKVILMTCSTGSTLGLDLAARFPDDIHGLLLYSPNIDVYDPNAKVLTMPWGLQIARQVTGSIYREWVPNGDAGKYWYGKYRLEGTVALKSLIDATMTEETFQKVHQPMLMLYYFKSEEESDHVVSIQRMKEMFAQVSTPENQKRAFAMSDVGHHIMTSHYFSKDLDGVKAKTMAFAEEVLGLVPIEQKIEIE